jgi:hypothetical protein
MEDEKGRPMTYWGGTPESKSPSVDRVVSTRAGWRYFDCEDCGHQWWETTRDRFSPSGTDCTCCNAWVYPSDRKDDPQVLTDANGNVWNYEVLTIKVGISPSC